MDISFLSYIINIYLKIDILKLINLKIQKFLIYFINISPVLKIG